jgi:hypothetical protein
MKGGKDVEGRDGIIGGDVVIVPLGINYPACPAVVSAIVQNGSRVYVYIVSTGLVAANGIVAQVGIGRGKDLSYSGKI